MHLVLLVQSGYRVEWNMSWIQRGESEAFVTNAVLLGTERGYSKRNSDCGAAKSRLIGAPGDEVDCES